MGITEFLLARIAEDEAAAKAATPGPWYWDDVYGLRTRSVQHTWGVNHDHVEDNTVLQGLGYDTGGIDGEPADLDHVTRYAPERARSEVWAKRQIMSNHPGGNACWHDGHGDPCWDLRALASVYADHPDYKPEWR
jgi:hypothetical protein